MNIFDAHVFVFFVLVIQLLISLLTLNIYAIQVELFTLAGLIP